MTKASQMNCKHCEVVSHMLRSQPPSFTLKTILQENKTQLELHVTDAGVCGDQETESKSKLNEHNKLQRNECIVLVY